MDANKSGIPYKEQPSLVDEYPRTHNYPGMEDRMARMEVNIAYIRRDVDELRTGYRRISEDINSLKHAIQGESSKRQEQFTELRGEIGELRGEIGGLRQEMRQEIGGLRQEMRQEISDVRMTLDAMDSRLERKLEQHLLKLQSRMFWTIGAAVGPIMLAWFIQTFLPALRASSGG